MADVDFYLKIDGVEGETQRKGLEKHMEIDSFSWGETNAGSWSAGSGGGVGKVSMQDFHFVKKYDSASTKLFLMCAQGKPIPKATLIGRKAGGEQQEYFRWEFEDCHLSSYQTGASGVTPTDQISFNFAKLTMKYKTQNADGGMGPDKQGWYDQKKTTGGE